MKVDSSTTMARDIFNFLQIRRDTKYAILRFVSWNATHDKGQKGIDRKTKYEIISLLKKNGLKVLISSESELPTDLKKYQIT